MGHVLLLGLGSDRGNLLLVDPLLGATARATRRPDTSLHAFQNFTSPRVQLRKGIVVGQRAVGIYRRRSGRRDGVRVQLGVELVLQANFILLRIGHKSFLEATMGSRSRILVGLGLIRRSNRIHHPIARFL